MGRQFWLDARKKLATGRQSDKPIAAHAHSIFEVKWLKSAEMVSTANLGKKLLEIKFNNNRRNPDEKPKDAAKIHVMQSIANC